jgi:hypothetical protein
MHAFVTGGGCIMNAPRARVAACMLHRLQHQHVSAAARQITLRRAAPCGRPLRDACNQLSSADMARCRARR